MKKEKTHRQNHYRTVNTQNCKLQVVYCTIRVHSGKCKVSVWVCMLVLVVAYKVGQKTRPLGLTSYMFKTNEPIYVIFSTIQHDIFLNISVKSILTKVITQVVPSSNKFNNLGFHLQNQARSQHPNARTSLKYSHHFAHFFNSCTSWYSGYLISIILAHYNIILF